MPKSQLEVVVEWDGPITLAALVERLRREGHGSEVLVEILLSRDRERSDELCGPRYHPRPDALFERAGTKMRTLGTTLGKIRIRVIRLRDRLSGETFYPLFTDVAIHPRRIYQYDIDAVASMAATRMSYRNTREELGHLVNGMPSSHTINRRVIEDGERMNREIREREMVTNALVPDGTKLHGQDGKNTDVRITLVQRPGEKPRLRCLTVGEGWEEHKETLARTRFEDAKGEPTIPVCTSDMEKGLRQMMTPPGGVWEADHIHVVRNTGFALWEDGITGERKESIVDTVSGLLAHLRNSVNLHLPKGEKDAVEHRIKQTIKEFRRLSTNILNEGAKKAADFLRRMSDKVTVFATLALQGIWAPWNSNVAERLMGEVSKRGKHKWMSWTTHGGQALLTLLVVRTVEPDTHDGFWKRKLFGASGHLPDLGIKVTSTRLGAGC